MKKNWIIFCIAAILVLTVGVIAGCGDDNGANGTADNGQAAKVEDNGAGDQKSIEACNAVTQQDATKIFGKPASEEESNTLVVDPNMLGECLWSYDTETSSQLIQFRVWNGEIYFAPTADSETFDIGDKGAIRVNTFAGVDVEWVQDGKTITLSYFTTGSDVPDATTKVEEVKALAKQVEDRL